MGNSHTCFWYFFQVSLSSVICQSLCFHLLGRGKRPLCTDMHVFTTGQKDKGNKIEIQLWEHSILFSIPSVEEKPVR